MSFQRKPVKKSCIGNKYTHKRFILFLKNLFCFFVTNKVKSLELLFLIDFLSPIITRQCKRNLKLIITQFWSTIGLNNIKIKSITWIHILRGKNQVEWWYVPNVLGFTSKPDGFRQMCVWADSPDRYIQPLLLWVSNPSYMHAGNLGDFLDIWSYYIQTLGLRISYISRLHPTTTLVSFKPILYAGNLEHPLVEFEDILCGHVTSKFWFWEYPSFNPSSMHGTLLRNFENIWHNQGTFDPTTALLS